MITQRQYLEAVLVIEQYLSQLEDVIATTNQIIAKVPFLEQKAMLLSLRGGDKIEVVSKGRHLPSVNIGDVLAVEGVVIEPYLRSPNENMRMNDTCMVLTTVRRENCKKLLIKTYIHHYTFNEGGGEKTTASILYDPIEFKKVYNLADVQP